MQPHVGYDEDGEAVYMAKRAHCLFHEKTPSLPSPPDSEPQTHFSIRQTRVAGITVATLRSSFDTDTVNHFQIVKNYFNEYSKILLNLEKMWLNDMNT